MQMPEMQHCTRKHIAPRPATAIPHHSYAHAPPLYRRVHGHMWHTQLPASIEDAACAAAQSFLDAPDTPAWRLGHTSMRQVELPEGLARWVATRAGKHGRASRPCAAACPSWNIHHCCGWTRPLLFKHGAGMTLRTQAACGAVHLPSPLQALAGCLAAPPPLGALRVARDRSGALWGLHHLLPAACFSAHMHTLHSSAPPTALLPSWRCSSRLPSQRSSRPAAQRLSP
jgi:hypothetical protein